MGTTLGNFKTSGKNVKTSRNGKNKMRQNKTRSHTSSRNSQDHRYVMIENIESKPSKF